MKRILFVILCLILIFMVFASSILVKEKIVETEKTTEQLQKQEIFEAKVEKILEEKQIKLENTENYQLYQKLQLLINKGSKKGQRITVENGNLPMVNNQKFKINDKLLISSGNDYEGNDNYYIIDYIRRDSLIRLFIIFITLVILISKWRGIASIFSMATSFLVIFYFILPKILAGFNPVQIAIFGSLIIIPVSFYLSHGFNKKTTVAITGTIIALIITGILANIFVEAAKLTGFASEEAGFLQVIKQGTINIKGLLLCGIIIGVLGVLDDITISQSAIVFQLKEVNEKLKFKDLYKRAMNVGQDHIASMVNTLVLVYTGAALPLLLLFLDNSHSFSEIINYEILAEEIVRTLVGSIGLILAVPITTLIAVFIAVQNKKSI